MSSELILSQEKTINIYSNVGNQTTTITTTASTWEDLQAELDAAGVKYRGMNAVVGETQVSLQSKGAQLPSENFTLFLVPNEVKSGYADVEDNDDDNIDFKDEANTSETISKLDQIIRLATEVREELITTLSLDAKTLELKRKAEDIMRNIRP